MNILGYALALLLFAAQPPGAGKVTSDYDKGVDFAKYKTYTWSHGPEDYRPKLHDLLVWRSISRWPRSATPRPMMPRQI